MHTPALFFVSSSIGPRLLYGVEELFQRRLGLPVQVVLPAEPLPEQAIRVGYSGEVDIRFEASGILEEGKGETGFQVHWDRDWTRAVLESPSGKATSGDLPGLAFFLLSRYEEWAHPDWQDDHGRYPDWNHSHIQAGFRMQPLLEVWLHQLVPHLKALGLHPVPPQPPAGFSADLDHLSMFRGKSIFRELGAGFRDLIRNPKQAKRRWHVRIGNGLDPYEAGLHRLKVLARATGDFHFFVWCGNRGPFDTGMRWTHPLFSKLLSELSEFQVGLHASYAAFQNLEQTKLERTRLETLLGREVHTNRFHFLRFRVEEGWQRLADCGITDDFSMGLSSFPGYRAGTGLPFRAYHLGQERALDLVVHPFCLMDSPVFHRLQGSPGDMARIWEQFSGPDLGFLPGRHVVLHNEFPAWPGWEHFPDGLVEKGHFTH